MADYRSHQILRPILNMEEYGLPSAQRAQRCSRGQRHGVDAALPLQGLMRLLQFWRPHLLAPPLSPILLRSSKLASTMLALITLVSRRVELAHSRSSVTRFTRVHRAKAESILEMT